jgi:hypothetical protein
MLWCGDAHLSRAGDPVSPDALLRVLERHPPRTHRAVELPLQRVFLLRVRPRLWPEIGWIVRGPPELDRNKVVLLISRRRSIEMAGMHLFALQFPRVRVRRSDRPRPSSHTDRLLDCRLRHLGIKSPGGGVRLGLPP